MKRWNRQTSYDSVTWNRPRWVTCDEMLSKYVIRWRVYWIKIYNIYIDRLIKVIIYSFSSNILVSTAGRWQLIPEAYDCSLIYFIDLFYICGLQRNLIVRTKHLGDCFYIFNVFFSWRLFLLCSFLPFLLLRLLFFLLLWRFCFHFINFSCNSHE